MTGKITDVADEVTTETLGGDSDAVETEDLSELDRGDLVDPPKKAGKETEESEETDSTSEEDTVEDGEEEASGDDDKDDTKEGDDDKDDTKEGDDDKDDTTQVDDPRIPKKRFDVVNERMKAAEAEIRRRDSQSVAATAATQQEYDFDAAERKHSELVLDGDIDAAVDLRKEIRSAERASFQADSSVVATNAADKRADATEINRLISELEEDYPEFDSTSDAFSTEATEEIYVQFNSIQSRARTTGQPITPGMAFSKAAERVVKLFDLAKVAEEESVEEEVEQPGKPIKKVSEKIAASKKAAPVTDGAGKASDSRGASTPDIETMTDVEFDALPESTLARMRGDLV